MFSGVDNIKENFAKEGSDEITLTDLVVMIQDLDNRMPIEKEPTSNETTMKFLPSSASLSDVISAVNELIKRDLTRDKVQ